MTQFALRAVFKAGFSSNLFETSTPFCSFFAVFCDIFFHAAASTLRSLLFKSVFIRLAAAGSVVKVFPFSPQHLRSP